MHVAFIISSFHPLIGGAERIVRDLGRGLVSRGIGVTVVTRQHRGLARSESLDGISVQRVGLPAGGRLGAASFVVGVMDWLSRHQSEVHVIHSHSLDSPLLAGALGSWHFGVPLIVTPHNESSITERARFFSGRARLSLVVKAPVRVVALTRVIHRALADLGIEGARIVDIPNGVDTGEFRPADTGAMYRLRQKLGIDEDAFAAVFVGRLVLLKRVDSLLETLARVSHSSGRRVVVFIVGEGPERRSLEGLAARLDGRISVRFTGATAHVVPYLQAADVFVLPSLREGLSRALLEAMSCGLCIVVSGCPGNLAVVTDGQNGLVFPVDRPAELERLMVRVMEDAGLRSRLSLAARGTVEEQYSLQRVVLQHAKMYKEIVSRA